MPTTTARAYRYPLLTAAPNVPQDLGNLASDVDADIDTWVNPKYVYKENNQDLPSSVTLQNDTELFFSVAANATYEVKLYLLFGGLVAAGIKTAWTVPASTTGTRMCFGPGSSANDANADNIAMRCGVHLPATSVNYSCVRGSASNLVFAIERCRLKVGATAGTVQLQWAQFASAATATRVGIDSYFRYKRVA